MILASQSPRRIELMREAGYDVRILPADVNEAPLPGEDPFSLVDRLACTKAATALRAHAEPSEVVLAADTIVTIHGIVLGKPVDAEDAHAMLRRLSGRTHTVRRLHRAVRRGRSAVPRGRTAHLVCRQDVRHVLRAQR